MIIPIFPYSKKKIEELMLAVKRAVGKSTVDWVTVYCPHRDLRFCKPCQERIVKESKHETENKT